MKVVTAGIVARGGRVLICQRPAGKPLSGYWEFPGGKLEKGETPEAGLTRELREELGFEARIGEIYDAQIETEFGEYIILYYRAEIASGEPRALEHADMRYVSPGELGGYRFASSDKAVARRLAGRTESINRG
jgi:8-oxo-dGTP diphosphatase